MGRQLGRCKKCNCQATIDERDSGICIWCAVRKLENEDISWLLAERDRLRAELARVKAESLRVVVVPDGEAYSMDDVDIWRCVDNMLGLYMYEKELLLCDDGTGLATPVRLERWEDE